MSAGEFIPYQQITTEQAQAHGPDVVVPTSYSSNIEDYSDGLLELRLSHLSNFVIQTSLAMWGADDSTKFVIAGEYSFGAKDRYTGQPLPSTGDLMHEVAREADIPEDRIHVVHTYHGKELNNTPKQLRGLREYLRREPPKATPLALAFSFHIPRLLIHARALNVPMLAVSIEDLYDLPEVRESFSEEQQVEFKTVQSVLPTFAKRETLARLPCHLNSKGRLLDLGLLIQGPRLHDADLEAGRAILGKTRKARKNLEKSRQALAA